MVPLQWRPACGEASESRAIAPEELAPALRGRALVAFSVAFRKAWRFIYSAPLRGLQGSGGRSFPYTLANFWPCDTPMWFSRPCAELVSETLIPKSMSLCSLSFSVAGGTGWHPFATPDGAVLTQLTSFATVIRKGSRNLEGKRCIISDKTLSK